MQNADLFESFDIIGPNLKTIDSIISKLKVNERHSFQEMGKIPAQTYHKFGFDGGISDSNKYQCDCDKQGCFSCESNFNRNSFIFPDGISYSIYAFDGEQDFPEELQSRIKKCCKTGLLMEKNFHLRREGLFFTNNMRDNPIFDRKNYVQSGLVEKYNSTQKLFFVGQRQEDFIFLQYDNIQANQIFKGKKSNGSYNKINVVIIFQVAYVFCTIYPILMLFENILFKFQHYISNKRCYFVQENNIPSKDFKQTLNYIQTNDSLNYAFYSLKNIKPDVDKVIECSPKCDFQIGKFHMHDNINPLSKWIYVNIFKYIQLDQLLCLMGIVLTEKHLFICSQNITLLTSFMIGLEYLLKPLDYQGQFIYSLPQVFIEKTQLLDLPIPVVYGIHSSYDKLMLTIKDQQKVEQMSFIFDLDFKTLYTSDANRLQIQKETDFITSSYRMQLDQLFSQMQPFTKKKSFIRKVSLFFQPQKKNNQKCQELLSQFTLNYEFTAEEYCIAEKIINVFHSLLEKEIIEAIKLELQESNKGRNNSCVLSSNYRDTSQNELIRSASDFPNQKRTQSNFYKSFKNTQIFQNTIIEDLQKEQEDLIQ